MAIREQLIRKALLALEEVVEQAEAGPVAPSFAIRFALAYLYVCGVPRDGVRERWMHDAFWREMQAVDRDPQHHSHRATATASALQGIMRSVALTPTFESLRALTDERARATPEETARRRAVTAMRDEAALHRETAEDRRAGKDCGWL